MSATGRTHHLILELDDAVVLSLEVLIRAGQILARLELELLIGDVDSEHAIGAGNADEGTRERAWRQFVRIQGCLPGRVGRGGVHG
jgi:hypothetical protein